MYRSSAAPLLTPLPSRKTCTPQPIQISASLSGRLRSAASARDCSGIANSRTTSIESRRMASSMRPFTRFSTLSMTSGSLARAKKRLRHSAIIGVVRRINFQGELAHGADVFLRGNGNTHGRVGAESLPVLAGVAKFVMPQDHGHRITLKIVDENTLFAAASPKESGWLWMGQGMSDARKLR